MLERVARYTAKEHCQVVEKSLVQELERLWSIWNEKQYGGDQEESLKSQIAFLLRLTNVWVSWKSGSLICDPVKINKVSTHTVHYSVDVIELAVRIGEIIGKYFLCKFMDQAEGSTNLQKMNETNIPQYGPNKLQCTSIFFFIMALLKLC